MGYDTHNSIRNLGAVFVFTAIYLAQVGVYFVLRVVQYVTRSEKKMKFLDKWAKVLFYSEILCIGLEAYFEWLIAGVLNHEARLNSENGE